VMTQINVCYCGGAEIRRDEMYSLGVFIERTGLTIPSVNQDRKNGLTVLWWHGRTFIRGGDWIDYLIDKATFTSIPDAGPTDADMRGEVEHGG
jgi:hypothetical protein